jgi:hypothetical protein
MAARGKQEFRPNLCTRGLRGIEFQVGDASSLDRKQPARRPRATPWCTHQLISSPLGVDWHTGMPEMPCSFMSAHACASVACGWMVTGLTRRRCLGALGAPGASLATQADGGFGGDPSIFTGNKALLSGEKLALRSASRCQPPSPSGDHQESVTGRQQAKRDPPTDISAAGMNRSSALSRWRLPNSGQ